MRHIPPSALLVLLLVAGHLPAAAFNARVSDLSIPLNGVIRLTFATSRPDHEHVDIGDVVRQAAQLPTVTQHWRLVQPPTIKQYERAKDVAITVLLTPRHSGQIAPPDFPIKWLEGGQSATFPTVTVTDDIRLGGSTVPVPKEVQSVGGWQWGLVASDYATRAEVEDPGGDDWDVEARDGLVLHFKQRMLAAATLRIGAMTLAEARPMLMQRWGDPIVDDPGHLAWVLGWVRIDATTAADLVVVQLRHEGVEARQRQARVKEAVFDVLDGQAPAEPDPDTSNQTPDAAAETSDISDAEIEAELERNLEPLREAATD